jgi:hypothetical protein
VDINRKEMGPRYSRAQGPADVCLMLGPSIPRLLVLGFENHFTLAADEKAYRSGLACLYTWSGI